MIMYRVLLLISLNVVVNSYHPGCEWVGHSPFCGYHDCPNGWTEIVKRDYDIKSKIAEPPGYNCVQGYSKLCCKNEYVNANPQKFCDDKAPRYGTWGWQEKPAWYCAEGRVEILERVHDRGVRVYGSAWCCDKEVLRMPEE